MSSKVAGYALVLVLALSLRAEAHFLWWTATPAGDQARAELSFSEDATPGDAALLSKVAHTQVWIRDAQGKEEALKLAAPSATDDKNTKQDDKKTQGNETGTLSAALSSSQAPRVLEAVCDYGVVTRGEKPFRLHYFAKSLLACTPAALEQLGHSPRFALDIVPRVVDGELELQVLFQGKPLAAGKLLKLAPHTDEQELALDSDGKARMKLDQAGTYAFRAGNALPESGAIGDKKYDQVKFYTTLTFTAPLATAPAAAQQISAAELLKQAREARAVWKDFPGFSADLIVRIDGRTERGHLTIDRDGTPTLQMPDSELKSWADQQAASLVQHRLPSFDGAEDVQYADDQVDHPLGRLINLGDPKYHSAYRIRAGAVTEVNRADGKMHFTISVLKDELNQEGKHLPRFFTVTFWNGETDEIQSAHAIMNDWVRVGNFDLPTRILDIQSSKGTKSVKELELTNHEITKR